MQPLTEGRATCYRCFAPQAVCYCSHITPINNRTQIIIAQHPREEFHPLNTARMVERSLINSRRIVAPLRQLSAALDELDLVPNAAVLYPSPQAELLEDLAPDERPKQILVLDGTWHHAKTLLRDVPRLAQLRKVRFVRSTPSEYTIRKEPHQDYLSTVEAVHHVLSQTEPDTPQLDQLLVTFRHMIALHQAAHRGEGRNARFLQRSKRRPHRFPALLSAQADKLVTFYAEGSADFSNRRVDSNRSVDAQRSAPLVPRREPLWCGFERPFCDEHAAQGSASNRASFVLKTSFSPAARLLDQMAITPAAWERGVTRAQALVSLSAMLEPDDIICVWHNSTAHILLELGLRLDNLLVLKSVYCDYQRFSHFAHSRENCGPAPSAFGDLEQIACRHGIPLDEADGGRGVRRLRLTTALLGWLRKLESTG